MARQRDSKLVGTVGNLIFYNSKGDYRMRTKPVSVKRTTATVNSGFNFGKASKMSRQIRSLIANINPCKSDNQVMYRFTGAVNRFISWKEKQDPDSLTKRVRLPFIQDFQFNKQADLSSIFAVKVSVNRTEPGKIEINLAPFIPSQSLQAPANTNSIQFKMILTETNLTTVETEMNGKAEIEIPYTAEIFQPPPITIPSTAKSDDLVILVMAVQYMVNRNGGIEILSNQKKLPCAVVWAGLNY